MINKFNEWFEGTFENKIQAFSFPAKFAMVRLIHRKVGNFWYGEQAYNYQLHAPYRTFIIEPMEENGRIRIRNYHFDRNKHLGFKNLESIEDDLTHKTGCDSILEYDGRKFTGGVSGCECHVIWNDKTTYMTGEVVLGKDYYHVIDRGYLLGSTNQVWGGKYGKFEFQKLMPS